AGKADVIGVAAGASGASEVEAFRKEFGWAFPVIHDRTREIAGALGAHGTPAAALVVPEGDGHVARDTWYPYGPGTDVLVELRVADDPWSVFRPDRYVGNRTCGACHVQELDSWLLTHHAVA